MRVYQTGYVVLVLAAVIPRCSPFRVCSLSSVKRITASRLCETNHANENNVTNTIVPLQNEKATNESFKSLSAQWPAVAVGTLFGLSLTLLTLIGPTFLSSLSPSASEVMESSRYTGDITAPVVLFQDILTDLQADYIDKIDPAKLFKTGIQAMLQSLDPYTEFEDLNTAKTMQESVSGKYGGVGLVIGNIKQTSQSTSKEADQNKPDSATPTAADQSSKASPSNGVFVVDAFEGYAYDSNMRPGDRLISIDGVDCSAMDVDQVRDLLRGVPDTQVSIRYKRDDFMRSFRRTLTLASSSSASLADNTNIQESVLKRQLVRLSDVRLATLLGPADEGVGYINLAGFSSGAGRDFRNALLTLRQAAPSDLKGLILDLRGNPGGLLDMAVEVASYLVPEGSDIVSARGKAGPTVVYRSSAPNIRPDGMKLVVLVNKGSASASEIVAGAVQDLDAGLVLGSSSTYGKGLVQKIIPLPYDSALKYTIARYFTPSGRCIQSVRYTGGRGAPDEVAERTALPADHPHIDGGSYLNSISSLGHQLEDLQEYMTARWEGRSGVSVPHGGPPSRSESVGSDLTDPSAAMPNRASDKDKNLVTPDNVNGGVEIAPSERTAFRTLYKNRVVRDAGGIEPDVLLSPLNVGPAEGVFYTQGVYPEFAKEYIRAHNVRRDIRAAALSEQITRNMDDAYASAPYLTSMKQYYVPQQDTGLRRSKAMVPSNLYTSAASYGQLHALSIPFRDVNSDSTGRSQSVRKLGRSAIPDKIEVPDRFFWGKSRNVADRAQLYREFKQFVVQRLNTGDIVLDAAFSTEEHKLQSALESAGFDSKILAVQKTMGPKLRDAFLADMDLHKDSIVDGLERVILSSELSDRLVMYHGALRDPQIAACVKILRGESILPFRPAPDTGDKIAKKIANKLGAMSRRANSADVSGVSYNQVLGL